MKLLMTVLAALALLLWAAGNARHVRRDNRIDPTPLPLTMVALALTGAALRRDREPIAITARSEAARL